MKLNLLPAQTGLTWVKLGVTTFFKQPLALSGLFLMFMVLVSLVSMVPYIGSGLAIAILPAATLGLMAASREVSEGRFPMPTLLFIALRGTPTSQRGLALLGVSYAMSMMGVVGLVSLADGGAFAHVYMGESELSTDAIKSADFQRGMLLFMMLYLPLSMLFWHAPALVHWHGVPVLKSLVFSFIACLRNWSAWLSYSLGWFGLILLVTQTVVLLVASLLGATVAALVLTPVVLTLGVMFLASMYYTVRDSFAAPESENL